MFCDFTLLAGSFVKSDCRFK